MSYMPAKWRGFFQQFVRKHIIPAKSICDSLPQHGSVLEIGCGEGVILKMLGPNVGKIVGVDFDKRKLIVAAYSLKNRNIDLVAGDAFEYVKKQPDGVWDNVLLVDTLSSFPRDDQFMLLEEVFRILSPSGMLFLKMIDGDSGWKTVFSKIISVLVYKFLRLSRSHSQSFHYLSSAELKSYFCSINASFELIVFHRISFHPVPHILFRVRKQG